MNALDIMILHGVIVAVVSIAAYVLHMRTMRLKAGFNLYRVRDRFVLLVANGVLPEDSRVFRHYYGRINGLLESAPNVGLDDILEAMFRKMKPGEFDQVLSKAREQARQMLADPIMQRADVRDVVADYYRAINLMILSHSSIVRVLYLLSHRFATRMVAAGVLSGKVRRGLEAADYADEEARTFKPA